MDNKLIRLKIKEIKFLDITREEKINKIDNLVLGLSLTRATRSYIRQVKVLINRKLKKKKEKKFITSYGEGLIEKFLVEKDIEYVKEKTFSDLINIHTNCNLRFDFYLPKLKTCIEFDGKQHFQYSKEFDKGDRSKLKYRQYLDSLKNIYCENKDLKLIRISYKQYKSVDKILNKLL